MKNKNNAIFGPQCSCSACALRSPKHGAHYYWSWHTDAVRHRQLRHLRLQVRNSMTSSSKRTKTLKRKQRFLAKYVQYDNVLCQLFAHVESV